MEVLVLLVHILTGLGDKIASPNGNACERQATCYRGEERKKGTHPRMNFARVHAFLSFVSRYLITCMERCIRITMKKIPYPFYFINVNLIPGTRLSAPFGGETCKHIY